MAKAKNKTAQTVVSPEHFLETVEPAQRREDGFRLLEFFNRVTGMEPVMWGPSMIGYGRYAYTYESGRSGEFFMTGFSPRKAKLSIYVMPGYEFGNMKSLLDELGPHSLGKSCLYITKLDRISMDVLEDIVKLGLETMQDRYETWPR